MQITTTYGEGEFRQFKGLIANYWPHAEVPAWDDAGAKLPKAVLAIQRSAVIGGLSFVWYPKPGQAELGLWINTLMTDPFYRKSGVASALVKHAMEGYADTKELFVYTSVPSLYLKLGWSLVSVDGDHHVLKYLHRASQA
jgi:hypothetical protein